MQGQTSQSILGHRLQCKLRSASTEAERALWQHLRGRQLEGCKFRRQHPFLDYIVDFACLECNLVIELDGGQHTDALRYDARRTEVLEQAGFTVLRFWNNEVFENPTGVLEVIQQALQPCATPSPPNPPLEGEG